MGKGSGKGAGNGCEGIAKLVLIILNFITAIFALGFLAIGLWIIIGGDKYIKLFGSLPKESGAARSFLEVGARILIGVSSFMLGNNFLAWISVCRQNKCLLYTYSICLGAWIVMELCAVIIAGYFGSEIETVLTGGLVSALTGYSSVYSVDAAGEITYSASETNVLEKAIDSTQIQFECCGVNNSTDYVNTTFPISCCAVQTDTRGKTAKELWNTNDGSTYTFTINDVNCAGSYAAISTKQGCYTKLRSYVVDQAYIILAVAAGALVIQIVMLAFAIYLGSKAEGSWKDYNRDNSKK